GISEFFYQIVYSFLSLPSEIFVLIEGFLFFNGFGLGSDLENLEFSTPVFLTSFRVVGSVGVCIARDWSVFTITLCNETVRGNAALNKVLYGRLSATL